MQDIARVVGGGTPSTTNPKYWLGGDIPWITPADLSGYEGKTISRGARNITRLGLERSGATLLPSGSVLFSSRAPIGYVAIASNPVATNQGFKSFLLEAGVIPDYVYYYLQFAKPLALSLASGTTFQEISGQKAGLIPAVVAPTSEQYRIVEAIDSYLARLDDAFASLERVQVKLKAYRASVLKGAVEGRLVPTEASLARAEKRDYEPAEALLARILEERRRRWEEAELARFKAAGKTPKDEKWKAKYVDPATPETDTLPEMPEGWCWATLEQLGSLSSGGTPTRSRLDFYGGTIPWVKTGELTDRDIWTSEECITPAGLESSSAKVFPVGTLLVAMYGATIGMTGRLAVKAATNQACAAFLPDNSNLAVISYIQTFLISQRARLRQVGQGGAQPNISQTILKAWPVPLPPLAEQQRIVQDIARLLSVTSAAYDQVELDVTRLARLKRCVLRWAFEGKLVNQDATEEPAERLLARIRAERALVTPTKKTAGRKARGAA